MLPIDKGARGASKAGDGRLHPEWARRHEAGESVASIARTFDTSRSAVTYALRRQCATVRREKPHMEWWPEAKRRHLDGKKVSEIAQAIGVHVDSVYHSLKRQGLWAPRKRRLGQGDVSSFIQIHRPREIRQGASPSLLRDATAAFARGEIDRAEMMRRITPSA